MGAGFNRMNTLVVIQTAQGLYRCLLKKEPFTLVWGRVRSLGDRERVYNRSPSTQLTLLGICTKPAPTS